MGVAAAIGGTVVAGLASSVIQGSATKSAANTQANADIQAANIQAAQFQQTNANLAPYRDAGTANIAAYQDFYKTTQASLAQRQATLDQAVPQNIQPMTMAQLVQTPGYQFQLQQGQRGIENSAAAQGLGVSGAALSGASSFNQGLAASNYQQQFANQQQLFNNAQSIYGDQLNNYQANLSGLNTTFNQLGAPVGLGENAAATTGNVGATAAGNEGQALTNAGVAQSAGITGQANATASGINSLGNSGLNYLGLSNVLNQGTAANGGGGFTDSGTFDA